MPNGDPDWHEKELPQLEEFFAPIAERIRVFATKNRLSIDRYYHQAPGWSLRFRHPEGGEAYVEIRRVDEKSFVLLQSWWMDDSTANARSIKLGKSGPHSRDEVDLTTTLQTSLDEVRSWQPGEWTQVAVTYEEQQRREEGLRREALQLHLRMLRPPEDAG